MWFRVLKLCRSSGKIPLAFQTPSIPGVPLGYTHSLVEECLIQMLRLLSDRLLSKFCTGSPLLKCILWEGQGSPQMRNHPIKKVQGWLRWCVPIAIHGDGTPSQASGKAWAKILDVWSCWAACAHHTSSCISVVCESTRAPEELLIASSYQLLAPASDITTQWCLSKRLKAVPSLYTCTGLMCSCKHESQYSLMSALLSYVPLVMDKSSLQGQNSIIHFFNLCLSQLPASLRVVGPAL